MDRDRFATWKAIRSRFDNMTLNKKYYQPFSDVTAGQPVLMKTKTKLTLMNDSPFHKTCSRPYLVATNTGILVASRADLVSPLPFTVTPVTSPARGTCSQPPPCAELREPPPCDRLPFRLSRRVSRRGPPHSVPSERHPLLGSACDVTASRPLMGG